MQDEKAFEVVRVFERRQEPGGLWHYTEPDPFPGTATEGAGKTVREIPRKLPTFTSPAAEDLSARTAIYDSLDSNVGAEVMAFTHTPIPQRNTAVSVERLGPRNPSRPFRVVSRYLQDLVESYIPLISFNTTVEKVEKDGSQWVLTLRRPGQRQKQILDFWWQEKFDAVVVASGHYNSR